MTAEKTRELATDAHAVYVALMPPAQPRPLTPEEIEDGIVPFKRISNPVVPLNEETIPMFAFCARQCQQRKIDLKEFFQWVMMDSQRIMRTVASFLTWISNLFSFQRFKRRDWEAKKTREEKTGDVALLCRDKKAFWRKQCNLPVLTMHGWRNPNPVPYVYVPPGGLVNIYEVEE